MQGRLVDLWKQQVWTNQGSNFLRGSFSNRETARAPTKFRGERQS